MSRIVSSLRGIKPEQRKIILEEALRLNGDLKSLNGFGKLRRAVQKKCGINVNNVTLRRVLRQQFRKSRSVRPPKHKWVGIRPSPGRMCSK